jgi:superoxide reductase
MTSRGQIWKCNICGNVIEVLHEGADSLVCCG